MVNLAEGSGAGFVVVLGDVSPVSGVVAGAVQALKSIAARITDTSKIRFIVSPLSS